MFSSKARPKPLTSTTSVDTSTNYPRCSRFTTSTVRTLTSDLPALSAHVVVTDGCLNDGSVGRVLDHLQHCLANHFDVEHSTFQLEAAIHADHEPGMHA